MANNTVLNSGSGGNTAATDDVAGVHYQRVKLTDGTEDSTTVIAAGGGVEATALRVTIASDSTGVVSVDDNGGSLTVDGTVTANLSATDNAVLDAIAASVAGTLAVSAASLPLPTGAATAAKQPALGTAGTASTDVITIQGIASGTVVPVSDGGGSLTVDGTVAVSGTVTVGSHAVTNAGTFATQVDGAALTALQLIDNLVLTEDAAHSSGDPGAMALAVRRDADTSLVGTDGDYAPLQVNAAGSLKVAITSGAGSGGTSIADGATFTRDTTSVTLAAAAVESSAPTLINGDAAALSMTTGGALRVAVASGGVAGLAEDSAAAGGEEGVMMLAVRRDAASSGVSADGDFAALSVTSDGSLRVSGGGGGTQYAVDAVAGATDTGTLALLVRDDALATVTPADGDYTQGRTNARGALWVALDSTAAQNVTLATGSNTIGALTANQSVNVAQINGVTTLMGNGASGTGAQRVTIANDSTGILAGVTTVTTVTTVGTLTGGGIAHDSADSGNPVKVGARAATTLSDDTMIANGDRSDMVADLDGALITRLGFPMGDHISENVSNTNGTSTAFSNFGAVASTRSVIYGYSIFRTDAGTTPIYVDFRDGTAGAVLWSVVLPPNGGANLASPVPLFKTTANTALAFDVSAATTTVYISVTGCKTKA
jgi:hypothetical protein